MNSVFADLKIKLWWVIGFLFSLFLGHVAGPTNVSAESQNLSDTTQVKTVAAEETSKTADNEKLDNRDSNKPKVNKRIPVKYGPPKVKYGPPKVKN